MSESREGAGPSISEAMMEIMAIEYQINVTGSVDSEQTDLAAIRRQLETNKITPAEAISQARTIVAGRQDYH